MPNVNWFFRTRHAGDAIKEGVDNYAFKLSIDTLVREAVQNVNDQRIGTSVIVEFVVHEVQGDELADLLSLIGWDAGLKTHLDSIAKGDSHLRESALRALAAVKTGNVRCLLIRDVDARGLEGPEDGREGNFVMLCRHVLVTDSEKKALKGGSFGLGKSILWAFSSASTVLFSSLPFERTTDGKGEKGSPRFFGRAYLVSHEIGSARDRRWHNGDGHLGHEKTENNGDKWTVSVRADAARDLTAGTILERDWERTGTSILIPFLDVPNTDDEPTTERLLEEIKEAIQKWFWPSLQSGILNARVGQTVSGREDLDTVGVPSWARYFTRSVDDGAGNDRAEEPGHSAAAVIPLHIQKRNKTPANPSMTATTGLFVTQLSEEEAKGIPRDVLRRVALVRGAQMVVEYHGGGSISALLPDFVGVLKAGEYHGGSAADKAAELLLRDAEPPAHDRWDPAAQKLKLNYAKGVMTSVRSFLDEIGSAVSKLVGTQTKASNKVPRKLAELLKGGKDGGKKREEKFSLSHKSIDRTDQSLVKANLTIKRNRGRGPWIAIVRVALMDEQGTKRPLPHDRASVQYRPLDGVTVDFVDDTDDVVRGVSFLVADGTDEIDVEVWGVIDTSSVGRRSMADAIVTYPSVAKREE